MTDIRPPNHLPGMPAWVLEYEGHDGRYGIVLNGAAPDQIIRDNIADLPGLELSGEHGGTVDAE